MRPVVSFYGAAKDSRRSGGAASVPPPEEFPSASSHPVPQRPAPMKTPRAADDFASSPDPAAGPAAAAVSKPFVDATHLAAMLAGMPPTNLQELLLDLHATAVSDYLGQRRSLAEICAARDHARLLELVHGMKGCFAVLGWTRFAARCAEVQTLAKQERFAAWTTFPAELHALYEASDSAMQLYLVNGIPADVLQAALERGAGP